jgi:membrane peptidoglycan carboxypeptidase
MTYVRDALFAAEGEIDEGGLFHRLYDDVNLETEARKHYGHYSLQLSRQLFCDDHRKTWRRLLFEIRTSIQLERHFTKSQLLDIYLNRAFFGTDAYGIDASEHYLAKPANQLSLPDAALLIGLIKSPGRFSPLTHPHKALARRNEVIDAMSERGSITSEEAGQAKIAPLGTIVHVNPKLSRAADLLDR